MPVERPKPTILIVEDEEGPRNALRIILRPFYELAVTSNRAEAMQALLTRPVDLVTLDLKLPDGYGLDLFHAIKQARRGAEIVIITGYGTLKSSQEAVQQGAAGYLLKPFNVAELITLINRTLERKHHLDDVRVLLLSLRALWQDDAGAARAWARLRERFPSPAPHHGSLSFQDPRDAGMLSLFADLMEASDRQLLSRAQRVCGYAAMLAAPLKLDQAAQHDLAVGAFLHDVGCVAMECGEDSPEHARERPAADDPLHAALGARMAAAAGAPDQALQAIAHHHERHDGSGYPDGLAGERIPLPARIVAVAQAFDRLTAASGRAAMPFAEACEHLGGQAGTALDPGLVELFLECLNEREPSRPARTGA